MNSALIKQVLAQGDFGALQTMALLLFVGLMLGVGIWIYWPGSKPYYDRVARDILRGDSQG